MLRSNRVFIAVSAALLAAGAMTHAQEPLPKGQLDKGAATTLKFEDWDKNKDGYIGKDEVPNGDELQNKFAFYDANADGKLSHDEFAKYKAAKEELARNKNTSDLYRRN